MIRFFAILLFFLWLLSLNPVNPIDDSVSLRWLPFMAPSRVNISLVFFGVGSLGLGFAALLSIFDQLALRKQNHLLRRDAETMKKEISSLRAMLSSRERD